MKTIYNAQGEAKTCDAVDAREHIATGRWFSEAPVAAAVAEAMAWGNDVAASTLDAPVVDTPKRGRK